jgi:TetR/AcrR family transcriptional regulator, tetracycline repressor protein
MSVNRGPGKSGPTRPGRPPVLSRQRVLTSAMGIVDEHGLEGLTMRRLGATLGVDPMAIYHHVPDKAALFDGLVERVMASVELPPPTGRWPDDLRATARAVRRTLLAHPQAIPLLGTRPPTTEAAFDVFEAVAGILLRAGFTAQQAADGVDCAARTVIGHTLAEGGRSPGVVIDGGEAEHEEAQQSLPPDRYPGLSAIGRAGIQHDPDRLFELALDGLELVLLRQLATATR